MTRVDAVMGRYVHQPDATAVADGRYAPACGKVSFEMVHCADCDHRVRLEDTKDGACKRCSLRRKMKEVREDA